MNAASNTVPSVDSEGEKVRSSPAEVHFRSPSKTDGEKMWQLVKAAGELEPNTCYAYLLLATHFSGTCLVAEQNDKLVGFVAAYRPPSHPEAVFVWQVGVAKEARGQGLAKRMLHQLIEQPACRDCTHLEATVAPSNEPSLKLFHAFAREQETPCDRTQGFVASDFGPLDHEAEDLYRIGPFRRKS